jgi:hypothetical protein
VTRVRVRGHIVAVDAEGIVGAVFRQHTSREVDPRVQSHVVIPNRVKAPDGRWLALDARTIKLDQRTLSGLYHAGLRTELTRRLGVKWNQPVHVELRYAQTSHANQGRTVDTALLLIDAPTDTAGICTPMTRVRSTNQAYVVCEENQTPVDVLTQALGRKWIDRPAVARLAEANGHPAGTSRWPCLGDLTTDDPARLHRRRVLGRASTSRDQSIGR